MIYLVSLTKIGDTKEFWGIDSDTSTYRVDSGVTYHSPFSGVSAYSTFVDTDNLKLQLGDDKVIKAFEYAKHEIIIAMLKRERSFWRDEMGKVVL